MTQTDTNIEMTIALKSKSHCISLQKQNTNGNEKQDRINRANIQTEYNDSSWIIRIEKRYNERWKQAWCWVAMLLRSALQGYFDTILKRL